MKGCKNGKARAAKQAYDGKLSLLFERSACCTLKRKGRFMKKPATTIAGGGSLIFFNMPGWCGKAIGSNTNGTNIVCNMACPALKSYR
ncbi:hypothetical protein [Candidatus Nitrotoga fabula]|uniref:hypothetical protein n=1 Tax=Candidatus Nitrotoga fabula TaxID=2182327 RepID=UPI001BB48563|nr:hypothetical protein [Candidatus Nitrotoga fabula]